MTRGAARPEVLQGHRCCKTRGAARPEVLQEQTLNYIAALCEQQMRFNLILYGQHKYTITTLFDNPYMKSEGKTIHVNGLVSFSTAVL